MAWVTGDGGRGEFDNNVLREVSRCRFDFATDHRNCTWIGIVGAGMCTYSIHSVRGFNCEQGSWLLLLSPTTHQWSADCRLYFSHQGQLHLKVSISGAFPRHFLETVQPKARNLRGSQVQR